MKKKYIRGIISGQNSIPLEIPVEEVIYTTHHGNFHWTKTFSGWSFMASIQSVILRFLIRKTVNWNKPLAEVRSDLAKMGGKLRIPPGVTYSQRVLNGVKLDEFLPSVNCHVPAASRVRLILYVHGGGYSLGLVNTNRNFVMNIARQSGLRVDLMDYRLAPENPFPAALEDFLGTYRGLLAEGVEPGQIVVMGDSSGCGLALAGLTCLRDAGDPLPAGLIAMCPMVDQKNSGDSFQTRAAVDPYHLIPKYYMNQYVLAGQDPGNPLLSPLYADLHGLPPILIHAADRDVFLSDATRLAEKARQSGVTVTLKIWDSMWHVFQMSAELLPEGQASLNEIITYLQQIE
jgi:epsilon-lactone hydrolase